MTRWDRILIAAVAVAAALAVPLSAFARPEPGVVVSGPGGVTTVPVGESAILRVAGRQGVVTIHVRDGEAWVSDADCPDQVCVRTGRVGDGTIVCAPNGVVVRVGKVSDGLDARSR